MAHEVGARFPSGVLIPCCRKHVANFLILKTTRIAAMAMFATPTVGTPTLILFCVVPATTLIWRMATVYRQVLSLQRISKLST